MNKVVDLFSNYTNDIFGLFSTSTKQMEKIFNAGIENLQAIVESGHKIGKDAKMVVNVRRARSSCKSRAV